MRGHSFRNRWIVLLFVCITLAGVTKLIGTPEKEGAVPQLADRIAAERTQPSQAKVANTDAEPDLSIDEVPTVSDAAPMDDTLGLDPRPVADLAPTETTEPDGSGTVTSDSRDFEGSRLPPPPDEPGN